MIALSKLPDILVQQMAAAHLPPLVLMLAVVIFYILAGCVMDFLPVMIITFHYFPDSNWELDLINSCWYYYHFT